MYSQKDFSTGQGRSKLHSANLGIILFPRQAPLPRRTANRPGAGKNPGPLDFFLFFRSLNWRWFYLLANKFKPRPRSVRIPNWRFALEHVFGVSAHRAVTLAPWSFDFIHFKEEVKRDKQSRRKSMKSTGRTDGPSKARSRPWSKTGTSFSKELREAFREGR